MAAYNKFQQFVEDLGNGVHNLTSHTLKLALSNTAPTNTDQTFAPASSHPPPASANGYTSGGESLTNTAFSQTGGTATPAADKVVYTVASGQLGPFRYAILYNDTPTSPRIRSSLPGIAARR